MDESFWQEFRAWEKQASDAWTTMIRSPEFIDLMNQQLESWLLLKQQLDRATEEAMKTTLLPSRAEQERIALLIHEIAIKAELLGDRIDRLRQAASMPALGSKESLAQDPTVLTAGPDN